MKYLRSPIFLIVFICSFSVIIYAQNFWEQMPFPDTVHAHCAAVNSQNIIFAGTATADYHHEGVYRSVDQGNTWVPVLATNSFPILDIAINVLDHIYVGTGGYDPLRVSTDNGETWQSLPFNTSPICNIHCVGPDTIYIGSSANGIGMLVRSCIRAILGIQFLCIMREVLNKLADLRSYLQGKCMSV